MAVPRPGPLSLEKCLAPSWLATRLTFALAWLQLAPSRHAHAHGDDLASRLAARPPVPASRPLADLADRGHDPSDLQSRPLSPWPTSHGRAPLLGLELACSDFRPPLRSASRGHPPVLRCPTSSDTPLSTCTPSRSERPAKAAAHGRQPAGNADRARRLAGEADRVDVRGLQCLDQHAPSLLPDLDCIGSTTRRRSLSSGCSPSLSWTPT